MAIRDTRSIFTAPVRRRRFLQASLGTAGLLAIGSNLGLAPSIAAAAGKLEIFSWWTAPGEVEALQALYGVYNGMQPGVDVVNAALGGGAGAGGNMKAVLQTRMLANQPPDSFQVHVGHELIDGEVKAGRMEPIDFLYESEGWSSVFNQQILPLASADGHQWSVPVNIHRSNLMWYSNDLLAKSGVSAPPASIDDWFAMADALKAQGIPAMALGESSPGHAAHYVESLLQATFGADDYKGLWTGATSWSDPRVTQTLTTFNRMLDYANPDYLSVSGSDINDYVIDGKAASMVNGDWTNGYFKSKKFTNFSYLAAPGCTGIYSALGDSFGLPIGAPDRDNAIAWLKMCGSLAGQDAFNPIKGSIPVRTDGGKTAAYDDYQHWALNEFATDTIVPGVVDGFAAKDSWVVDYDNAINVFATNRDIGATAQALLQAAQDAGVA